MGDHVKKLFGAIVSLRGAAVIASGVGVITAPANGTLPEVLYPDSSMGGALIEIGLWAFVLMLACALLLPGPRVLTIVRILVPAVAVTQVWAAVSGASINTAVVLSVVASMVAVVLVLLPAYGEAHVDAASYGTEKRFLLRPPAPVMIALVVPLWVVSIFGVATGPLLLVHSNWVAGVLVSVAGLPAAALAAHTLFRLARRWLVFVPNGVVVHDYLAVAEPLPLGRRAIRSIGPAPAISTATDLTVQALGLALQLRLREPVTASVRAGRKQTNNQSMAALLVSPSRPAAVMSTARHRGIKIA